MTGRAARLRVLARDVLPVVVVAWMVFHAIRTELLERYLVESRSMEPTLHGDSVGGDVVLVDKTAWWGWRLGRPERFALVVLRNGWQQGGNNLVKRLVAEGPSTVWIEAGDLYVQPDGAIGDARVVKHPLEHEDLRQTSFVIDAPDPDAPDLDALQPAPEVWTVVDGAIVLSPAAGAALLGAEAAPREQEPACWLPGFLSTARPMDSSFLDARGRRVPGGRVDVRDVGLDLELRLDPGALRLHLVVELLEVRYDLVYDAGGRVSLRRNGELVGEPDPAPPLPEGRAFRIRFGYLDGRFFVAVDDELAVWRPHDVPWSSPRDPVLPGAYRKPPANLLHVGVEGAAARLTRLRGFHDLHYASDRRSVGGEDGYRLEPGQIFVLGDNSFDSADSRDRAVPFEYADLIGRPMAIIAPPDRLRWL